MRYRETQGSPAIEITVSPMTISIITINRNDRKGLLKTIQSVVCQTVPPDEFIIIDGASTDGSAELLKEYSANISYSVSEPDKGIYNAMNKGVKVAKSEYCIFMNSGDCFSGPDVIQRLKDSGKEADIICGNARILENPPRIKRPFEEISLRELYKGSICHQSALIRTRLLIEHPYDETLKIVADRKFFLQTLIMDGVSYGTVDIDVVDYDINGFSARNRFESEQEWKTVLWATLPHRILEDYGKEQDGLLYGNGDYENLFHEIGKRNWRKPVYRLAKAFLGLASIFFPSARFSNSFPW